MWETASMPGGFPGAPCACGRRHGPDREAAADAAEGILARSPDVLEIVPLPLGQSRPKTPVAPGPSKRDRRKLWEIPHKYHCPVIGTCLGVPELRRIGARQAPRPDGPASDFEVHVSFVAAADDRNSLSLAAHKALERKFRGTVKRFERARDAEAVLALWSECVARGEVAAAFWALMTHPQADIEVQRLAYEEVHMLSHQVGAGNRADLKRLSDTLAELATLRRDFDALFARSRQREALIGDLDRRLAERESALAALGERERALVDRLAALESEREAEGSARRIADLERRLAEAGTRLAAFEAETASARLAQAREHERAEARERELAEKAAECATLERRLAESLDVSGEDGCAGCPNTECPDRGSSRDLAGRLILCVGGRLPQVQHLARLVEDANGRFDHHDGGLEDRDRRLEALLAGADAVICATDYVSHTAYYRTKRYCKRHAKPHVLVPRSGLAAFALALERVAG